MSPYGSTPCFFYFPCFESVHHFTWTIHDLVIVVHSKEDSLLFVKLSETSQSRGLHKTQKWQKVN